MTASGDILVRLEEIDKRFGRVHANRRITLDLRAGRVRALLGENGAGKSTLMSILAGRLRPDAGRIHVDGRARPYLTTRSAIAAGIGMVYQHFMLIDAMTVAENVLLGQHRGRWLDPARMERLVADLAATVGLGIDPGARVADLSMGERQRVEILKLLQRQSRVLIFDEPTSVLTPRETAQLFVALRQMAAQGRAVVFISHKLGEVMEVAEDIAILRRGAVIDDRPAKEFPSRSELARRMVGREVLLEIERPPMEPLQPVLQIEGLRGEGLEGIDLRLRQGEILGVVGVGGNGQAGLVNTVCGLTPPADGEVRILGRPWSRFYARHPAGLAYIPEDRQGLAVCPRLDLTDNFLLTTRRRFCRGPWLQRNDAAVRLRSLVQDFDIRPGDVRLPAASLSGGNLQKLVLAREFFRQPRLIVADQPTQGLDIQATIEVWQLLLKARERAGVLLVTGDLNEALALCDRLAVMYRGRVVDQFAVHDQAKVDNIGLMMAGVTEAPG